MNLNLQNIKPGDEIVTIRLKDDVLTYSAIYVVTEWDERFKRWRYNHSNPSSKYHGAFPPTGEGYDFMSKRKTPDFYYSANPKHIKAAKKSHEKARKERIKAEKEKDRRMKLAMPIGELLEVDYYDSEECYNTGPNSIIEISETLISRLTDEQIITLKGWLGV